MLIGGACKMTRSISAAAATHNKNTTQQTITFGVVRNLEEKRERERRGEYIDIPNKSYFTHARRRLAWLFKSVSHWKQSQDRRMFIYIYTHTYTHTHPHKVVQI